VRGRDRVLGKYLPNGFRGCRSTERRPAGEQFVEDRAQGVNVRRCSDVLYAAARLLARVWPRACSGAM
jgi:hypothetical protein